MINPLKSKSKTVEDVMGETIGQLKAIEEREQRQSEKLEEQIKELNQKKETSDSEVSKAKIGIRNFTKLFTQELPDSQE